MKSNLDVMIELVCRHKKIDPALVDPAVLATALERAILEHAQRTFGGTSGERDIVARLNPETGVVDLFHVMKVVADESEPTEGEEITLGSAQSCGLEVEIGDELLFQIFYLPEDAERAAEQTKRFGSLIRFRGVHEMFGRTAALTAKLVIQRQVHEACGPHSG